MRFPILSLAVVLAGCFTVDPQDGAIKCNAQGECPTNYYCSSGTCWRTGHFPPDGGDSPDLTVGGSEPDLASACGDTQSNPQNCGTCGHDCTMLPHVTGQGVTCADGECVVPPSACAMGFAHCSSNVDDGCEADLSKATHCGSCTNACPTVTPLCAGSGTTFMCLAMCMAPTADICGSQCVNLATDANNCKTCGSVCSFANASSTCSAGGCQMAACNVGYKDCQGGPANGCETYVKGSDKTNCGDCGTVCSFPNAGATCNTGACQIGACTFGFADCKNGPADGCETNTQTDPNNCSACATKCGLTEQCSSSACGKTDPTCAAGCDATCVLPGQFSVDGNVAVDYVHGKKKWMRGTLVGQGFDQAKISCSNLNLDGIVGWRLPTTAEWKEISVKCGGLNAGAPGTCSPCIDQGAFPVATNMASSYATSETMGSGATLQAVNYDTTSGRSFHGDVTSPIPVKCIHD